MIRAGVPKGLNLQAATNGDADGFFENNTELTTTGDVALNSALLQHLGETTGIEIGQYVSGNFIPAGTTIIDITAETTLLIESGTTAAGSPSITALTSSAGLTAGVFVSGTGIPDGAKISSISGAGPYTVTLDQAAFQSATGSEITFTSPSYLTMSASGTASATGETVAFYSGAQVGYRMVFGRVETDINGTQITRLGAPSALAIATNILGTATNCSVTGTIPKNSDDEITFVRLYRSDQTESVAISPLDQYLLVYERNLDASDFLARTITITDDVTDSLRGIPLYTGSDQEGSLQANYPPPSCWDMCKFRDFVIFGNITAPTTLKFTIVAVGAPSGVQLGDTITVSGGFLGVPYSETYTASSSENAAARQFEVVTSGTVAQDIADTADSLIRVINYDEDLPVHAILISSATDLPGQITLEADNPSYDIFTVNASAHTDAYDPTLSTVQSMINTKRNFVAISKVGEFEAVPPANTLPVGDSSAPLLRVIALRDYVIALKSDGIYKLQGTTPAGMLSSSFDLTTKIIGSDTAVSLNSGVWMLSNQGVVSITDGGVDAKSIPVDDQLNGLIGSYLESVIDAGFAMGYESDRKYILCLPTTETDYTQVQYNFNYITNAWTTWSRDIYCGFVHSNEGKMYIGRAASDDNGVSQERKQYTYKDFVDEAIPNTIISVDEDEITLDNVDDVEAGDILYQSTTLFSPILEVDLLTNVVTVQSALAFTAGATDILKAYLCEMTWKQVFGGNPAFTRQFSEGLVLFKQTRFENATLSFVTDFSQSSADVPIEGTGNGLWGLFAWGSIPWGGESYPSSIRFYIPQEKQLGSYLLPTLKIRFGYSDFKLQGMSISYYEVSQEVGK
jgi:hypothetical protein